MQSAPPPACPLQPTHVPGLDAGRCRLCTLRGAPRWRNGCVKADPMYETNLFFGPFCYYYNYFEKEEKNRGANSKGLGKSTLLFPCSNGGRPDPKRKGMMASMGSKIAGALKTELIDCWKMPADEVATHVLRAAGAKRCED